ncbi:MAG: starch synthase [Clostridia bacterium]|nr:starch synthase [Clostridia bacterium]
MKVLFTASEAVPFVKTGGLGDVVGSLPQALNDKNVDVRVMIPKYGDIPEEYKQKMSFKKSFTVRVGWREQYCGIEELNYEGVTFYFIDNEYYFKRPGLYGFYDEAERYAYFCRAVLESLLHLDYKPHIIHCHDWHTGMISVLLKEFYQGDDLFKNIKTIFTIHNLKYQGIFPKEILGDLLGLKNDYFTTDKLEFYGQVNFLKSGLVFSDVITTVSPTYAEEIKTDYYGEKLNEILKIREKDLSGILNGIDYKKYNPLTDPHLFFNFRNSLITKRKNKEKLQEYLDLPQQEVPILAIVSRLVKQKGIDLLECIFEELLNMDIQMVVLGTGEKKYEDCFQYWAKKYPEKLAVKITFDESLAHKIYGGADIYLMPSLFEPCGLSQLIALRYGCIPIVRETGGLNDTVLSYNEATGEGNGFSFTNYNAHDFLYTIQRALRFYKDEKVWIKIFKNALKGDYSWEKSAEEYKKIYKSLLGNVD